MSGQGPVVIKLGGEVVQGPYMASIAADVAEIRGLGPAAVHEHHGCARSAHLGDVGGDGRHVRALHHLAAQLDDDGAVAGRAAHGQPPGSSREVRSSTPSMMFIDWMA